MLDGINIGTIKQGVPRMRMLAEFERDYLRKVFVEDMDHFARFICDQLLAHPAVIDVKSSFALERIKDTTVLPVLV